MRGGDTDSLVSTSTASVELETCFGAITRGFSSYFVPLPLLGRREFRGRGMRTEQHVSQPTSGRSCTVCILLARQHAPPPPPAAHAPPQPPAAPRPEGHSCPRRRPPPGSLRVHGHLHGHITMQIVRQVVPSVSMEPTLFLNIIRRFVSPHPLLTQRFTTG